MHLSEERTQLKFDQAMVSLEFMINLHRKPVWIVPTEGDYITTLIKPRPEDIPKGCQATLWKSLDNIIEFVKSSKR